MLRLMAARQPWQERSRLLPQFVFNHLQVHIVDVVALKSCLAKTFKIINLCVAFNARSPVHTRLLLSTLKLSALDRDFTRLYCQISQSHIPHELRTSGRVSHSCRPNDSNFPGISERRRTPAIYRRANLPKFERMSTWDLHVNV